MAERRARPGWGLGGRLLLTMLVSLGALDAAGAGAAAPPDPRRSGSLDMGPALQAMQADDIQNPAFLWVASGRERWAAECQGCHGAVEASMRGVASRYPRWNEAAGRVMSLNQQVRRCRERSLAVFGPGVSGAGPESEPVLALQSLVALQSRGMVMEVARDAATLAAARQGEALFQRRLGALALSCADCHEARAGLRLGGSLIPQAHPTAYPLYRLEWQGLGSLGRRLRACLVGVRATPFPPDGVEALAIEAYLMQRASGMVFEAPGLRP